MTCLHSPTPILDYIRQQKSLVSVGLGSPSWSSGKLPRCGLSGQCMCLCLLGLLQLTVSASARSCRRRGYRSCSSCVFLSSCVCLRSRDNSADPTVRGSGSLDADDVTTVNCWSRRGTGLLVWDLQLMEEPPIRTEYNCSRCGVVDTRPSHRSRRQGEKVAVRNRSNHANWPIRAPHFFVSKHGSSPESSVAVPVPSEYRSKIHNIAPSSDSPYANILYLYQCRSFLPFFAAIAKVPEVWCITPSYYCVILSFLLSMPIVPSVA